MASKAVRLGRKLRTYVNELQKITEEAKTHLSKYTAFDRAHFEDASWALQKSSALIKKCLSRIEELDELLTKECIEPDNELSHVLDSVTSVEVSAEMVLTEVETKLSYLKEVYSLSAENKDVPSKAENTNSPRGVIASEHETESEITSQLIENEDVSSECGEVNALAHSMESSLTTGQPRYGFNLTRFYGTHEDCKQFWLEFHKTVDKSPLETTFKFAALRGLVRGELYQVFLDLNYRSESDYETALSRLSAKLATHLDGVEIDRVPRSMPSFSENLSSHTNNTRWSDEYFLQKYCCAVQNYEKPNRNLLVRAIHAFLNFYTVGPMLAEDHDFVNIWLILLHGIKFGDRHMVDCTTKKIFGTRDQVAFANVESTRQEHLFKFAPAFVKKKDDLKKESRKWQWTYTETSTKTERVFTSKTVKEWYRTCWNGVETCGEADFGIWVRYFALLSMVLFRSTVKTPEAVEQYIACSFVRTFYGTSRRTHVAVPDVVPPHSGLHKLVRKAFKKNSANFKTYFTYLVGCYAYSQREVREEIRNYLNAGCLQIFAGTGLGSIYWLRKAADRHKMKPKDLLMYFLIDPSMESQVETVYHFIETYRKEVTWWWARLFERKSLQTVSTAHCPAFAYACFIIQALNGHDMCAGEDFRQFSRFIKDKPEGSSGKNLGKALRYIIEEWNTMPLSAFTQSMYKAKEQKKCKDTGVYFCAPS